MVSPRRLPVKREGRRLDGRAAAAFAETCSCGGDAVARGGSSGGILAGIFEVARKISGGVGGGAAAGVAPDRARILCAGGDGAARSIGKIVERSLWTWIGVYVWRAGAGVGTLQLAVCRATIDRCVRTCGSKATGRVGSSGRGKVADFLARDFAAVDSRSGYRCGAQLRTHHGRIRRSADGGREPGRRDANRVHRGV